MKAETLISLVSLFVGAAAAWWTYRSVTGARATTAPPAAEQYHARNNPYGFTESPVDGTWSRITPDGVTEWAT